MNDPVSGLVSPMLRLFRAGTVPYQPEVRRACPGNGRPAGFAGKPPAFDGGRPGNRRFPRSADRRARGSFSAVSSITPPAFASEPRVWRQRHLPAWPQKAGFGPEEYLLDTYRTLPANYTRGNWSASTRRC